MIRLGILENPLDPRSLVKLDVPDVRAALFEHFGGRWPATARVYDLEGVDLERAAASSAPALLSQRDVTPHDRAGVERLGELRGPLLVSVEPADPITAIIAIVAVAVGVAAAIFLLPKIPTANNTFQSPNNSLSDRTNQARPGSRIPDIFGTVRSTPDLLSVPYRMFVNNLEYEIAYMCVGRGEYDLEDVRDGDTLISSIAGAGATFYGPYTSPNSGAPHYQIGTDIGEPVLSVARMNEVNGQVLRPTNSNHVQGNSNIRFVYPDQIQRTGGTDFTHFFETDDEITIGGASIAGGAAGTLTLNKSMRFESPGTIRFNGYDPTADFAAADVITLNNAAFAGPTSVVSAYTLTWTPATFPGTHPAVLDRVKMVKLVGANPAKFYRVYHLFFKDIGTRAAFWIYQSDDAAGTNSVAVAAWVVGSGASNVGLQTVDLAAQSGSGITGQASIDFGDGTTSFATYNGAYADNGLGTPTIQTGGASSTLFVDLAGTYTITSVSATTIVLSSPSTVNPDWSKLANYPNSRTEYDNTEISKATAGDDGLNFNGTYTVLSVTAGAITLSNPAVVNSDWGTPLQGLPGGATEYLSPSLATSGERWVGPFVVDLNNLDRVLANFVALSGIYRIDKKGKQRFDSVGIELELTPVDSEDVPIGPAETFNTTLNGSSDTKETRAISLTAQPTFTGRCSVRARRTTPTDLDYEGTVVDEVKWRDGYGLAAVAQDHFGNVTTVHSRTYATAGATAVKDRKLNLNARRRLPERVAGEFTEDLVGTDSIDDIISAMALDPYIGNRAPEELDFDNIYDTTAEIAAYFGSPLAKQFGYTFDDDNISFEESLALVAASCFCRAYRQGRTIRLAFERATEDSVLLFNHRNVIPKSQERSVRFGVLDDHDGVELDWTAARDGAMMTYDIPYDRSAVKGNKIEVSGVRSGQLAYWHAWRAWNKMKYQSVALEQECTQEAALVIATDRVLITDLTRPPGFEGEVQAQLEDVHLVLSQPTEFEEDVAHIIFLQHIDGTVEALPVGPFEGEIGEDDPYPSYPAQYRVTLGTAPRLPLAVDPDLSARAGYEIVPATDGRSRAYLVTEREPNTNFTETLRVINYSPMYYINDEIVTWLAFDEASARDQSPWMRDGVLVGGGTFPVDGTRNKFVLQGAGGGFSVTFEAFDPPESYSKAAWLSVPDLTTLSNLLGNGGELFRFDNAGNIQAGHGGVQVQTPWPGVAEWHHVVATYDAETDSMVLFLDGEPVDEAEAVPTRALAQLTALSDFNGKVDDLRLWKRALTRNEVRALYRSTRQVVV